MTTLEYPISGFIRRGERLPDAVCHRSGRRCRAGPVRSERMKPEVWYDDIVMGDFIEDLIGDIEYNMKFVETSNSYFEQLSIEKFALEQLLQAIRRGRGLPPEAIVARFVQDMNDSACETDNERNNFVFSIARDAAQSVLDGLYFVDP